MEYHLQPIPVVLGSHVQNAFKAVDLWVCTVGMTMSERFMMMISFLFKKKIFPTLRCNELLCRTITAIAI